MRIVHHDRKSTIMRDALEATRRASALLEGSYYDVEAVAKRESTRDRRECVVDVWWTNERRVKIPFAHRSHKSKPHPTQRKLRISSRHIGVVLYPITNHIKPILFERCGELNAIRIVDVDDGVSWARPETTVKQSLLRVPVILHRLVIVEVIAGEICENGDRVFELVTTMEIHRLRRTLHYRRAATELDSSSQQTLHVRRFGRRAIGFEALFAETIFNRSRHGNQLTCLFGDRSDQISCCRFTVRARDADELQLARRMVLDLGGSEGHRTP